MITTRKEVSIYDIANKLKISVATVSRALKDDPVVNKKTKKKILELTEKLCYRSNILARNLRNTIILKSPFIIRASSLKKSRDNYEG